MAVSEVVDVINGRQQQVRCLRWVVASPQLTAAVITNSGN